MKKIATLISSLFLLISIDVLASAQETPESIDGTTKVTADEVIELVGNEDDLIIVDARIIKDRSATGFIKDSVSIPDTEATPELLAKHIPTKSTPIVVYCNGIKCGRSVVVSKMAVKAGYTKIYWFRGGWDEWAAKGLPVSH